MKTSTLACLCALRSSLLCLALTSGAFVGHSPAAKPLGGQAKASPARTLPNLIVIFVDDLGFADISPFAKGRYETPHLERMASEGRKFTNFYSASSVCTPSRAAIMTGCYPARVSMLYNETRPPLRHASVLWPGSRKGLNPDEVTIAEVLKERGYTTACFGKWHLGDQLPFLPTRHGFDEFYGTPNGHDMGRRAKPFGVPPAMVRNEKVVEELDVEEFGYLTKRYTEESIRFIRTVTTKNKEQGTKNPFFIYLPHNMVHGPHAASPAFLGKTGKGIYADAVAEIDWSVGKILDLLVELGIDEHTLVLFTSDNGGGHFPRMRVRNSSNAPFSGGKATAAEGGFRVPTIGWWPGTIVAGSTTDLMASTMDLLPTFASLAGKPLAARSPIDGTDVSSLFQSELPPTSPRTTFAFYGYFNAEDQYRESEQVLLHAVREGRWKYYPRPTRFLRVGSTDYLEIPQGALFDLNVDPGEIKNVANRHSKVVTRLKKLTKSFVRRLGDDGKIGTGNRKAAYVDEAKPMNFNPKPGNN
jgi:arylsulfatase A